MLHQRAAFQLALLLTRYAETEQHLGWCFMAPLDVVVDEYTVVQPDVYVHTAGPDATEDEIDESRCCKSK